MEKVQYLNHPNCCRLSNGAAEVILATDIGPRILRYALAGEENILAELPDVEMKTALGVWKPWGGHRLWAAPEEMPRSYAPDNDPVQVSQESSSSVRLTGAIEPGTGVQKQMLVTLDAQGTGVTIQHRIINHNLWGIELAPWALTIMRGGGRTILPQEPYRSHDDYLLPARPLVLWHFTSMADPRWTFGSKYITLKTVEEMEEPQKIGAANRQGWMAYHREGTLFVKRFAYVDGAIYPDFGCNCETYTAGSFMEVETLAPLHQLGPGEAAEHVEQWRLFRGVELGDTEESLDRALQPILSQIPPVEEFTG